MPIFQGRGGGAAVLAERPQLDGQALGEQARQIADTLREKAGGITSLATPAIASATEVLTERLEEGAKGASELASRAADVASTYGARAARAISEVSARGADVLSSRAEDAAAAAVASQAAADELARSTRHKLGRANATPWILAGVASVVVLIAVIYRDKIRQLIEASQPYQAWRKMGDSGAEVDQSDPEDDSMATAEAES